MPNLSNERERIETLQRMLCMLGAAWGEGCLTVPVCGVWNEATERAVRAFQEMRCLPVTGLCGRETWDSVVACCSEEEERRAPVFVRIRETEAGPGDEGDAVLWLQLILRGLEADCPFGSVPADGRYGAETEAAVRCFQRIAGLPETGRADRPTWLALAEAYNGMG
ncbi:MAG: peptidoglycan-binding protein [Ruminococcaceae bacterium]|nr:peptidoglycan-binding protein [Oscillospiraceae bacterium]